MGSDSPSKIRREGREDFAPYCDPEYYCPYNGDSFWHRHNKPHWMEGWREAEAAYVKMVNCKWCDDRTENTETQECDRCWELRHRIENDPELAKTILEEVCDD